MVIKRSRAVLLLTGLLLLMWIIQFLDIYLLTPGFDMPLRQYGIVPRQVNGLRGIAFAPFLHGGFAHLISNSIPFLILGGLVLMRGMRTFMLISLGSMLIGGLGTWLVGANGVHIGASGVIFAYLGFLLLRAWFERSLIAIATALVVGFFYGGLIWGVLPSQEGVSWESHLCGFIGGVVMARVLRH